MHRLIEEKKAFELGYRIVGAIDEAGRGPLAGPVVAACVTVTADFKVDLEKFSKINDSKKVTEKNRQKLFRLINSDFVEVGVGVCNEEEIDTINILEASLLAMKRAVESLKNKPELLLIDGNKSIKNCNISQKCIVKGDATVLSIAAASIIAKVTRDSLMESFHALYPQYGFIKHKGYATKEHLENISKYGPCKIHRKSFQPIKNLLNKNV